MTHIKRFNETKEEKVKDQEMEFNADSLEMEKDLNPDIKTEPVEHDEKELQNVKKNKIEKFNESMNTEITVKDIINFLETFDPETPVYLDKDGWQNYGKEDMNKNDVIKSVFDDSAITHRGKNYIMINN
jgi:hypothetical protein